MESELNLLLRRNNDGYKGYQYASESIKNENFRNFLKSYALQRKRYADAIKTELNKRNLKPTDTTSILGDIHESLVKLKESISGMSDDTILKECARGEDQAVSDYEKVLKSNTLPPDLQKLLMLHRDKINAAKQTLLKLAAVI